LGEELPVYFLIGGLWVFALVLALEDRETFEEQLADEGLGDGVAAVNAFADDVLEEIAEIAVDGGGGGETLDPGKKLVGTGFVGLGSWGIVLGEVKGPERIVVLGDERAAAGTASLRWRPYKSECFLENREASFMISSN
jgi:hypothetical protein